MIEARTIYPTSGTELNHVLKYCDEWRENRHYPHNLCQIVDYLADACRELQENQRHLEAKAGL